MQALNRQDPKLIRNFCIIAHIDHGKSTLADRLLELTGTLTAREMTSQVLDTMDLEREKGVTIKASAVRMAYTAQNGSRYELNLIDTPGHVDFGYEVSRALNACEGALLVVDASQGIEAQTLANLYQALDHDLTIIPIINKIDLTSANPDQVEQELGDLFGFLPQDILRVSAKENTNVESVLEAIVERIPPPPDNAQQRLRALIFDSHYDPYKGVVAYVRVVDGRVNAHMPLHLMSNSIAVDPIEVGIFAPKMVPVNELGAGQVGYIATGLKTLQDCTVGDTFTEQSQPAHEPLPGYRPVKSMVFAGFYPSEGQDYEVFKDALEKLQLNDAALRYEPESSPALGFGFRCGFLGLFHMEIIQERLEREYGLDLVATAPSVEYHILKTNGTKLIVSNPTALPPETEIAEISEPWVALSIFTPSDYIGQVMELTTNRRGIFQNMEYLDTSRVLITFHIPLTEILVDYFDKLKSLTRGYASMDYTFVRYEPADLIKLDVLVNEQPVDALSIIVHREQAYPKGQRLVSRLKKVIPRQQFQVPIQAVTGKKVISRANVKAVRKDVLAKCYGGDVTRKRKLLEKQKAGKKRLKQVGRVLIPQDAFMAVLRLEDDD
ncbi:MAG: elongation factor 4 [Anaerolineae bacterium]|nr:elongation factor 4 [Anaerolineae bacterium]